VGNGTGSFWVDIEAMTTFLPQWKVDDLVKRVRAWPPGRKAATVK